MYAALYGHADAVALLARIGADVNAQNNDGG
jgi:ankyrin repeat protein